MTKSKQNDIIAKNIFDILDLSHLPPAKKSALLQSLLRIIYQRVLARIIDAVPLDVIDPLKHALRKEDEDTFTALLAQSSLPTFATMMAEEALFMKYEMDLLARGDAAVA
ncbi:MAG: hypothetical protein AAB400_00635 [Patescibacteria group bacterium]